MNTPLGKDNMNILVIQSIFYMLITQQLITVKILKIFKKC